MAASIVNGVVGAGIFTLPAVMALQAGSNAPWAYAACGFAMAAVVICFADAGSRVPTSGGAYGTVAQAFGPGAGFVTGILLIVSCLLASGGITAALADMAGSLLPALSGRAGRAVVILAVMAIVAAVNLRHIGSTARLIGVATAFKLLPLLLFLVLGAVFYGHAAPAPIGHGEPGGFSRAVVLGLFAFCGMETPLGASGEIRDANRTLPKALFLAMGFVLILYLSIQFTAAHLLGADLAHSAAPLADAAGRVSQTARIVLLAGAGISMLSFLTTDTLGSSRMIFALARDGKMPRFLAHLQPGTQVPARAVLIYVAAAIVLALSGSFLALVVASALNSAAIYVLACAASFMLYRRRVVLAGPVPHFRAIPAIAAIGIACMVAVILSAQRAEILGLLVTILASAVIYVITTRVRRA
jgi:APA family basic amino acid/polyamine antiporter